MMVRLNTQTSRTRHDTEQRRIAADLRIIRSDIASIDIKLAMLPEIEAVIRGLKSGE
jgi:hypothetical protein